MENKLIKRTFSAIKKGVAPGGTCPDEMELSRFAEGGMDEKKRVLVEEHLISCQKCCDYVVSLHRVIHFPGDETLPGVPQEQVRKVNALVKDRGREKDSVSNLERLSQFLKDFFNFDFIRLPLPRAVKSCAAAAVVILMFSATYLYYQQTVPLSLTMEVVGKTRVMATRGTPGEKTVETIIKEGDTLFANDYCRINFELNRDAYAYVLYYDSKGEIHQLFPDPASKTPQEIKANTPYTVPAADDQWFQLDHNRGTETVFMVASTTPISSLKDMYPSIQGLSREAVLDLFKSSAPVFKVLSFQHQ
jgi:hypothetical protein